MTGDLAQALIEVLGADAVRRGEPLARYTTLGVGGPADLLALVDGADALRRAVLLAWEREVPCRVLGAGSNVLVGDGGVRGLVVINRSGSVRFSGTHVEAESGVSFSALARRCVDRGLAGLEWAVGIPGTVGGAVVGNAGAWGGDVASVLHTAILLEPGGAVEAWPVERLEYGYRTGALKRNGGRQPVVLGAEFALRQGDRRTLEARVAEIAARRKATQPPGATCGSIFKNPPGDYAGRLIEAAGLKGKRQGRAEISPRHANFIVNRGGATAADVWALIQLARERVLARFGVELELEIELVGRIEHRGYKD